jgi:hypothetical protein
VYRDAHHGGDDEKADESDDTARSVDREPAGRLGEEVNRGKGRDDGRCGSWFDASYFSSRDYPYQKAKEGARQAERGVER